MRILYLLLFFSFTIFSFSKDKINVYFFPGQGSDERLFSRIKLDTNYTIININYAVPAEGATMRQYAQTLSQQIDTTHKYILIGVSIGGMLCSEMADFLKPEKVIIISSAKCSKELPMRYTFQKTVPLNKLVPDDMIKKGAYILQPIFEPDRQKEKDVFKSMLSKKDPKYNTRTVDMIVNWNKKTYNPKIIHIHGTNDHTIPIRNVKANYRVKHGSHMMTLTRGNEIDKIIMEVLSAIN